jgi:hypothetical protein
MLSDLKTDFISIMTPLAKVQANSTGSSVEQQPPTTMLTKALNAFDTYACHLSVSHALKFKRSLAMPNNAEMFLQYNDAERQEHIQNILDDEMF